LVCWTQTLLLDRDLALARPPTLRYRLWHVAARIARHGGPSSAWTPTGPGPPRCRDQMNCSVLLMQPIFPHSECL